MFLIPGRLGVAVGAFLCMFALVGAAILTVVGACWLIVKLLAVLIPLGFMGFIAWMVIMLGSTIGGWFAWDVYHGET